jgi:hypothetical protein
MAKIVGLRSMRRDDGRSPDAAGAAHRADDVMIAEQFLELLAGVLPAAVGMISSASGVPRRPRSPSPVHQLPAGLYYSGRPLSKR